MEYVITLFFVLEAASEDEKVKYPNFGFNLLYGHLFTAFNSFEFGAMYK